MSLRFSARLLLSGLLFVGVAVPIDAQQAARTSSQTVRVTGAVRDDSNAITLPGIPVEVVGANQTVFTDVDGRYELKVPYSASRELLMDVLHYGSDAEIVEPKMLREQARSLLQLALSHYDD